VTTFFLCYKSTDTVRWYQPETNQFTAEPKVDDAHPFDSRSQHWLIRQALLAADRVPTSAGATIGVPGAALVVSRSPPATGDDCSLHGYAWLYGQFPHLFVMRRRT
jgi:hypothetical protein